jgi:hypothetical protein
MMAMVFRIRALTDKGKEGIRRNLDERSRMRNLDKAIMKKLFNVVVAPDFSFLEFRGKTIVTQYVDPGVMRDLMEKSMINENCTKDDFKVEME